MLKRISLALIAVIVLASMLAVTGTFVDALPGDTFYRVISVSNTHDTSIIATLRIINVVCHENGLSEPEEEYYIANDITYPPGKNDIDSVITFGLWIDRDGDTSSFGAGDEWITQGSHVDDIEDDPLDLGTIDSGDSITCVLSFQMGEAGNWAQSDIMTYDIDINEEEVEPEPEPSKPKPSKPIISVNLPPVAEAGLNQTIYLGDTAYLNGSESYDPDGWIVSYFWNFSDGETASGMNASHVYLEPSNYIVFLTVEDNDGAVDVDNCTITVMDVPSLPPFLDNLTITPAELVLGDEVTISIDIMNPNNHSFDYIVTMKIGELTLLVDSDMEAYESKTLSRTITPSIVGVYNVTVDGMTGSFTVIPIQPLSAKFEYSSLTITPDEVYIGEMVNVSVTLANVGELEGAVDVPLVVNGTERAVKTVTLGGLEAIDVIFTLTAEFSGTYVVSVDGLEGSFTVLSADLTPAYLGGLAILVIAIALLARRRIMKRVQV